MKTKIFNALPFFPSTGSIYWWTGMLQFEIFNPKIWITRDDCFVLFSIRPRKTATQTRFLLILAWKLTIFTLINNVFFYSIDRIKCEWINKSNFLFGGKWMLWKQKRRALNALLFHLWCFCFKTNLYIARELLVFTGLVHTRATHKLRYERRFSAVWNHRRHITSHSIHNVPVGISAFACSL